LIQSKSGWKELFRKSALGIGACVVILLFLSQALHVVAWNPKLPGIFLPWLFTNWIFVCISEEALLRGLMLKELCGFFGGKASSKILALLVSSLIFTLFHLAWVAYLPFLILVFVAGLFYGGLYLWTGKIEASIVCHGVVNTLHLLLFTYPALASIA
jgi:membrane protease YdiL (CAAX protease family)